MHEILPILSQILPIIASTLLLLTILTHFYLELRQKFNVNVNCWFCNTWSKVPWSERNGFYCPHCTQYNGFTEDGGYNKVIPEQHHMSNNLAKETAISSNGLCFLCNNNQRLKIIQLANFVPMNEANYDLEIEHFRKQLEKAYELCKNCNKVLNATICKQNSWLFGNRLKNKSAIHSDVKRKKYSFTGILLSSLIVITTLSIIMKNHDFMEIVSDFIPHEEYLSDLQWHFVVHTINIDLYIVFTLLGLLVQMFGLKNGNFNTIALNNCMCWLILSMAPFVRVKNTYSSYIFGIQMFCCCYLFLTSLKRKTVDILVKKSVNTSEASGQTDLSDSEEFTQTYKSPKNSFYYDSSCHNDHFYAKSISKATNFDQTHELSKSPYAKTYDQDYLSKSLHELSLGNYKSCQEQRNISPIFSLNSGRPLLSPPKLFKINNVVAMDSWHDDSRKMLSRASSESSGIGSQLNDQTITNNRPHLSHFQPINPLYRYHSSSHLNTFQPMNSLFQSRPTNHNKASSLYEFKTSSRHNNRSATSEFYF